MGISNKLTKILDKVYYFKLRKCENKKIKDPRRVELQKKVNLSDKEKEEIDKFFIEHYGKKVPYNWHRLYQSFTGVYQAQYFPEILFSSKLEPLLNDSQYRYVLDDKLLLNVFANGIEGVRTPKTIAAYCNGVYFDSNRIPLKFSDFTALVKGCKCEVVVKSVQDTSSGRGVKCFDMNDPDQAAEFENHIAKNKSAFIIQEKITQSPLMSALNPSSANTFRVITYICQGEIFTCPLTCRIGQGGNFLDNAHAGGMFIHVSDDGVLNDTAYTEFQTKYTTHPDTGVKFEGYTLPFVPKLLEAAKKCHLNVPQLGMISWDIAVDENGEFVLIEVNTTGQTIWFPQMASGKPLFGENTGKMLEKIR